MKVLRRMTGERDKRKSPRDIFLSQGLFAKYNEVSMCNLHSYDM